MEESVILTALGTFVFCCALLYLSKPRIEKSLEGKIKLNTFDEREKLIQEAKGAAETIVEKAKKEAEEIEFSSAEKLKHIEHCISTYNDEYERYNNLQQKISDSETLLKELGKKFDADEVKFQQRHKGYMQDLKIIRDRIKNAQSILNKYFLNKNFIDNYIYNSNYSVLADFANTLTHFNPIVELPFRSEEYKDLKHMMSKKKSEIKDLLEEYESRYKTKSNRSIYQLMVISLQSELQNIIYNLKFSNLEKSLESIDLIKGKYLSIASEGNQSINPTWIKFIEEISFLYKDMVRIEHEFYARKVQQKEEQAALREQMRQEAEEHKYLLAQEKKILKEEEKYKLEINSTQLKLQLEEDEQVKHLLKDRILELEKLLADVKNTKDEITNLKNGKAGFVYIISNLGSFGENVFKIGMTRRLDPQDRINELSNASVPFRFDVHSFIFSKDAVSLEASLHKRLDDKRVNKITIRKEFFKCTIDELEALVQEIQPTASFYRTMLAEQYRLSLEIENQQATQTPASSTGSTLPNN